MTINKRTKDSRHRGSHTHGGGAMKKRRGAGNRGGRGNAGSGKRGDAKKPSYWANVKRYGKTGFKSKGFATHVPINLESLERSLDGLTLDKSKAVELKEGVYHVNLAKLGYTKVLSKGKISKKIIITNAKSVTKQAESKITAAGGKVSLLESKVTPVTEPKEEAAEA